MSEHLNALVDETLERVLLCAGTFEERVPEEQLRADTALLRAVLLDRRAEPERGDDYTDAVCMAPGHKHATREEEAICSLRFQLARALTREPQRPDGGGELHPFGCEHNPPENYCGEECDDGYDCKLKRAAPDSQGGVSEHVTQEPDSYVDLEWRPAFWRQVEFAWSEQDRVFLTRWITARTCGLKGQGDDVSSAVSDLMEATALYLRVMGSRPEPTQEPVAWDIMWGEKPVDAGPWRTWDAAKAWMDRHEGFTLTLFPLYASPPVAQEREPEPPEVNVPVYDLDDWLLKATKFYVNHNCVTPCGCKGCADIRKRLSAPHGATEPTPTYGEE